MKLRVNNGKAESLKVILEPWATEYELEPGNFIEFVSANAVPDGAYFNVESSDYGLVVCPEWEKALVHAFNMNGELID